MGSETRDVDAKRLLRGDGGTEFKSGAMPKNGDWILDLVVIFTLVYEPINEKRSSCMKSDKFSLCYRYICCSNCLGLPGSTRSPKNPGSPGCRRPLYQTSIGMFQIFPTARENVIS